MPKKTTRSKSKPAQTYHHGELKNALLEAALNLLKTTHASEISLRKLARAAGVSPAAPYRHFAHKDELLAELTKQGFELKAKFMRRALHRHRDNPKEMFLACAEAYFEMGLEHPQHFKLMFGGAIKPDEKYPELRQAACQTFVLLRNMVCHCQKMKVLGPGDSYLMSLHCWSVVNGYTALFAENQLDWLGVSKSNAKAGLRSLLEQFLIGAKNKSAPKGLNFQLFKDEKSLDYLQLMETMPHEIE